MRSHSTESIAASSIDLDSLRKAGAGLDLLSYRGATPSPPTWRWQLWKANTMGRDAITDLLAISYSSTDVSAPRL
ncbi:MAG: hypothetical protein IPH53_22955 [Flavobacteriales bacterium]|nr:hypothetical protein [Flavobacteriales bacterium]